MVWSLTDPARDDLDGIWFHIAGDNVAAADKVVARLVERFDMLARQPLIGDAPFTSPFDVAGAARQS